MGKQAYTSKMVDFDKGFVQMIEEFVKQTLKEMTVEDVQTLYGAATDVVDEELFNHCVNVEYTNYFH